MESIACAYCGKVFLSTQARRRFCSVECGNTNRRSMSKERLQEKLLKHRQIDSTTGCWEWTAGLGRKSYGVVTVAYKQYRVPRLSAHVYLGFDLTSQQIVCHRCDNPRCFNPDHLFMGTLSDNMQDMLAKGRQNPPKGSRNGQARLTEDDVREIRRLGKSGVHQREVAERFGISYSYANNVINGERWKHVE
ncbi:HNH endonuclease [Deinococcus murrayi]|uniref:HNH endonuclease n=1 Tax=Deinococcus murrayi TaxID=68910 RepID=UPI0009FE80ED|nr:HNH endonuclease [Deinococcus murrayi]